MTGHLNGVHTVHLVVILKTMDDTAKVLEEVKNGRN